MTTEMPSNYTVMPEANYHSFFPQTDPFEDEETFPTDAYAGGDPETTGFPEAITHIYQEATTAANAMAKDLGQEGSSTAEDDGASMTILIAVIISTLLVFLCLVLVFRYMLKHKGSYYTNEDKEANWTDSDNAELKSSHSFDDDLDEDI